MSAAALEPNPERGQLFEVPRVAVLQDESDPTILKLAFSGSYELDRDNASQVKSYNALRAGQEALLSLTVRVVGVHKHHRLDSEGDLADIVESKRLVVLDVYFDQEGGEE
jgi:hypothetical protein